MSPGRLHPRTQIHAFAHGSDARAWFLAIVRNAFYDWLGRNRPAEVVHDEDT